MISQALHFNQEWQPNRPPPVQVTPVAARPGERSQNPGSPLGDQWPTYPGGGWLVRKYQIQKEIQRAESLPVGWDGYSAEPPSHNAIEATRKALDVLFEFGSLPVRAVALADGGMALVMMARPFYAAVELYDDGEVVVAFSDRKDRQEAWEVSVVNEAQLKVAIERLQKLMHG